MPSRYTENRFEEDLATYQISHAWGNKILPLVSKGEIGKAEKAVSVAFGSTEEAASHLVSEAASLTLEMLYDFDPAVMPLQLEDLRSRADAFLAISADEEVGKAADTAEKMLRLCWQKIELAEKAAALEESVGNYIRNLP